MRSPSSRCHGLWPRAGTIASSKTIPRCGSSSGTIARPMGRRSFASCPTTTSPRPISHACVGSLSPR
eukprot:4872085-Lingulodinium_polyedra.AAC.1